MRISFVIFIQAYPNKTIYHRNEITWHCFKVAYFVVTTFIEVKHIAPNYIHWEWYEIFETIFLTVSKQRIEILTLSGLTCSSNKNTKINIDKIKKARI